MDLILKDEIDGLDIQDVVINYDDSCPVCRHPQSRLISLFLINNITYEEIKSKIPNIPSFEILKNHKNHLLLERPEQEMSLVNSDSKINIDELGVTNSTIRALTARRMEIERDGLAGNEEHISVVDALYKWTRLKLEVNKRLGESKGNVTNIANIIKVPKRTSVEDKVIEHGEHGID